MPSSIPSPSNAGSGRLRTLQRAFHAYARWLVSISWKRFFLLALLLIICAGILSNFAPFSWEFGGERPRVVRISGQDSPRPLPPLPNVRIDSQDGVQIAIDQHGVRVHQKGAKTESSAPQDATPAASTPASGSESVSAPPVAAASPPAVPAPPLPPAPAKHDEEISFINFDWGSPHGGKPFSLGEILRDMSVLFVFASMILKLVYKGQMQAEQVASEASAHAEAEQLRRQLAEARMATLQAQIEPHFLFNTLASIEHLIQTDPPRAQRMQQHLIALLRASMPQLREAVDRPLAPLSRELEMLRPYLAIQKIRMEERLETRLEIPEGLLSAEWPPLMLQTLVENAIRHGLEPQPDGGVLEVKAEVADGQLIVHVIDNGAGLSALSHGTDKPAGTGLENIRERLRLHYGAQAGLELRPRTEGGTHARLHLPYRVATLPATAKDAA